MSTHKIHQTDIQITPETTHTGHSTDRNCFSALFY